jgi:hypothetical protein
LNNSHHLTKIITQLTNCIIILSISISISTKMNRQELIQKCKDLGIKGISTKTKPELLQLIVSHEQPIHSNDTPSQPIFAQVMHQLTQQVPKDKSRKVCKQCHELGHGVTSVHCKINIEANDKLKQKIKTYISSQNCLDDKTVDDHCTELSASLGITPNQCNSTTLARSSLTPGIPEFTYIFSLRSKIPGIPDLSE